MNTPAAPNPYSATLRLPQTSFPMRANLPAREPGWVAAWLAPDANGQNLYARLRAKRANAPKFIVHLGPPYANGNMHLGHALTYVLKDFIVRHSFLSGLDSPYAPGWDCHGLPTEWKIEQELRAGGQTKQSISLTELRARCRASAAHWVSVQKAEWQRFGCLADWDNPYLTMNRENEGGIVAELGKLVQRGMVYRGLRSTQWSWAEETALSDAEVEYKNVQSTAVYVALPLVNKPNEHLVIWTTTPWTLPANRAVAIKADETYVALSNGTHTYWVAQTLQACASQFPNGPYQPTGQSLPGSALIGWAYQHPLYPTQTGQVFAGSHVTTESGTGLVHIAPAHGAEDFALGKEHNLPLECPVDGAGKYESWVPALPHTQTPLAGLLIWPAQKLILAELTATGLLLHSNTFEHSYPVSWRSKEKLIFRSTYQWFIALDDVTVPETGASIRHSALNRIYGDKNTRGVTWVPAYGANRIGSMVAGRPDWCISRQRAWGVPITIMVNKATQEIVADPAVWQHLSNLVSAEGIDAWDTRLNGREAELFPAGWLAQHGLTPASFEYVRDILDVWFDSGTSHAHVLRHESAPGQRFHRTDGKRPADVYLEGSDQHRGWFHSSLLTSVAIYGDAPYETVITNGFVVDGQGRKFSKSLGNGVEPHQLLSTFGMDILRLWIASADYQEDIRYSPNIMEGTTENYRRFRNTLRWLLGNLPAAGGTVAPLPSTLPALEHYILHRLHTVLAQVREHYQHYQFHLGVKALLEFCIVDLSNFYVDVRKDVLYCDSPDSPTRQATISTIETIFRGLVTHLAPLMPFTAHESWQSRYGEQASVHEETYAIPPAVALTDTEQATWQTLFELRTACNIELEKLRTSGSIGTNLDASAVLPVFPEWVELARLVIGLSQVTPGRTLSVQPHSGHKCPRCWRFYEKSALAASGLCLRCEAAVPAAAA